MNDKVEYSLDPEDWQSLRALGHQMLDDMFEHLENIRETPVWQPIPAAVKAGFKTALPHKGQSEAEVYAEFQETIVPYQLGNLHPRFWGWVMTTGTPLGMLAEMLTGALTTQMGGGEHSGV